VNPFDVFPLARVVLADFRVALLPGFVAAMVSSDLLQAYGAEPWPTSWIGGAGAHPSGSPYARMRWRSGRGDALEEARAAGSAHRWRVKPPRYRGFVVNGTPASARPLSISAALPPGVPKTSTPTGSKWCVIA